MARDGRSDKRVNMCIVLQMEGGVTAIVNVAFVEGGCAGHGGQNLIGNSAGNGGHGGYEYVRGVGFAGVVRPPIPAGSFESVQWLPRKRRNDSDPKLQ